MLASPRRRRRLIWGGALAAVVLGFLVLNMVLPSHGGPVRRSPTDAAARGVPGETAAERAAADRAAATVHPLANAFVDELANRHDLGKAFELLAPRQKERFSEQDWTAGRDLPLTGVSGETGGASVAFAGRDSVGLVASFAAGDTLFAVRFDKLAVLGWRVAYMKQGHASSKVGETAFSPPGFAPGSYRESLRTWAILLGGLAGLIVLAALLDWRLGRPRAG